MMAMMVMMMMALMMTIMLIMLMMMMMVMMTVVKLIRTLVSTMMVQTLVLTDSTICSVINSPPCSNIRMMMTHVGVIKMVNDGDLIMVRISHKSE